MRILGLGFAHHARMRALAPHDLDFRGLRRGPVLRRARLLQVFGVDEIDTTIGQEAFPDERPRVAAAAVRIIRQKVLRSDAVAVWNGSRDAALAAVRCAEVLRKPIVYVENGFLPGTVQIDREGVNYRSSVAKLTAESLPALPSQAVGSIERIQFRQRPLGRDTGLAGAAEALPTDLPNDFILFAAQVHDDSQIRRFSPDFDTVEAAIRYVASESALTGRALVVKEHPSDHGRIDYRPLKASLPEVRFLDQADNAVLIERCSVFVTVNSSLALQAVYADRPVFTLGDAAYNLEGIAHRVRPPEKLHDALTTATFDRNLRRHYLDYLAGVALVPFRSRMPSDDDLLGVLVRMSQLLTASR